MAPLTRLRSRPERRINYADTSDSEPKVGFGASPQPIVSTRKRGRRPAAHKNDRYTSSEIPVVRVKAGAVVKPKSEPKVRKKALTPKKKKKRPTKQECSICATEKITARSFKAPDDACEHLQAICTLCFAKMLKTKIAERQLRKAELSCPISKCDHTLGYATLKAMVSKAAFKDYDKAVTKYALSMGESYVACLSAKCGLYFSAEDCKNTESGKQLIACPYCEYEICLKCNRPWKSHGRGSCDQAKKAEDELCEQAVKNMGAKPCPNCKMNIQKHGGCDHMTCRKCRHNFCWVCLAGYTGGYQHLDDCPHARVHVAIEPGAWMPDNLTDAQVNNLIARATAHRDNPAVAPAPVLQLPPVPPLPPLAAVFGGLLNLIGRDGGGRNADEASAHGSARTPQVARRPGRPAQWD